MWDFPRARAGAASASTPGAKAAAVFIAARQGGRLMAEFQEVESGKRNGRPALAAALAVARIGRLARNARFLLSVAEGSGEAGVAFRSLPSLPPGPAGKFMLTRMAAASELEAGLISQRTGAASAAVRVMRPSPSSIAHAKEAASGLSSTARTARPAAWPERTEDPDLSGFATKREQCDVLLP